MFSYDAIKWFNDHFNDCYYVTHNEYPESLYMFYDKNFVRQQKLAKLEEKKILKTDITGHCLFELNWETKCFNSDYYNVWCYLRDIYNIKYYDFQIFINERLTELSNMNITIPIVPTRAGFRLDDRSKINNLNSNQYFGDYL